MEGGQSSLKAEWKDSVMPMACSGAEGGPGSGNQGHLPKPICEVQLGDESGLSK